MNGGLAEAHQGQDHAPGEAGERLPAPPIPSALAEPSDARAPERRRGSRRNTSEDRLPPADCEAEQPTMLPSGWRNLVLALFLAIALNCGLAGQLPPPPAMICFLLAMCGILSLRMARLAELSAEGASRYVPVLLAVLVPMGAFSAGTVLWATNGLLATGEVIATMVAVSTVAAAHFRKHAALILVIQLAAWAPVVVFGLPVAGAAWFAIGGIAAVFVAREQARADSERTQQRQARERAQTRARDILADYEETGQGWFWETDRRSQLTYVSGPVAKLLGQTQDALIGQPLTALFNLDRGEEGERTLLFHLSARSAFQELAVRAASRPGERWWSISGRPVYDQYDNFVGFRGSGTDLTEKRRSQEQASRLAHYDSLTGLANRLQMSQLLEKILSARQQMNRCCAVMLLDLDRFKQVNDTMGHPAGDALLKQVAQRIERVVGKLGRVGRLGGDEFQVIVPQRLDRARLGNLALDIINAVSQPYAVEGHSIVIGASVGIAIAPDDGATNDQLIRNADLALYAAKDAGRGRFHFYAENLHAVAEARAEVEKDLRKAIVQGELQLFYQPVVSTASERIAGFEALLRWNHPEKGWIPPDKFVSVAEDSGLIAQIGEWALRTACHHLASWPAEVRCAVNVSPLQFANRELPAIVTSAIAQAGIDPSRLELEITESVFLNDDEGTEAMFAALKRIGVRLALDDFGTGYSSLGYLKTAPFDKIKIDQSFVRGATEPGSRNGAIIASITSLAQALDMDTTAEGVETLDELDLVRMHGCSHVQGFIYDRPLDAAAATERLRTGLAAVAKGPRSSRAPRQRMLRRVMLEHSGQVYSATIRNMSGTGALIEGVWNVPVGTVFKVQLSERQTIAGTVRWSAQDRIGLEFAEALRPDGSGWSEAAQARPRLAKPLIKAG
ncbi:EAL domain-containing protein [Altererythrobacter soli]|uniref:EAL domain-containing protein n=2 Tax=Croceibacterium soli TaxID=1739690 RepID=A0A6I4UTT2_9SPHN|nr:EAL domain-containing protein [Croceibacterium soli]